MPRIENGNSQPFSVFFWETDSFSYPVDMTSIDVELSVRGYNSVSLDLSQVAGTGNENNKTGTMPSSDTSKLPPGIYDCMVSTSSLGSIQGKIEVWPGPLVSTGDSDTTIRIDCNPPTKMALSWLAGTPAFAPTVESAAITPDPVIAGTSECGVSFTTDIPSTSASYKWSYTFGLGA